MRVMIIPASSQKGASMDDAVRRFINEKFPDISKEGFRKGDDTVPKGIGGGTHPGKTSEPGEWTLPITPASVTRPEEVDTIFETVMEQHGRIDGIVHGAGIVRDVRMREMTTDDFSSVVQVKISGTLNLFQAARTRGIRFFTCLSSVVFHPGEPRAGQLRGRKPHDVRAGPFP